MSSLGEEEVEEACEGEKTPYLDLSVLTELTSVFVLTGPTFTLPTGWLGLTLP